MTGLQRLCKIYGSITTVGKNGKKVTWVWDKEKDKPVKKVKAKK